MKLDKRKTERQVAEEFLRLYNERFCTHYEIEEHGDAPDFKCSDRSSGTLLELEITLLDELPGFIESVLVGKPRPISPHTGTTAVSIPDESFPIVEDHIRNKLLSAYGSSTALVLKHVTGIWEPNEWEWFKNLRGQDLFKESQRSFGAGIWAVCTDNSTWPSSSVIVRLDSDGGEPAT